MTFVTGLFESYQPISYNCVKKTLQYKHYQKSVNYHEITYVKLQRPESDINCANHGDRDLKCQASVIDGILVAQRRKNLYTAAFTFMIIEIRTITVNLPYLLCLSFVPCHFTSKTLPWLMLNIITQFKAIA